MLIFFGLNINEIFYTFRPVYKHFASSILFKSLLLCLLLSKSDVSANRQKQKNNTSFSYYGSAIVKLIASGITRKTH